MLRARNVPTRLATGAYILHTGWEKWHATEERTQAVHGAAARAFPFLASIPPATFLRLLAGAEIATGAALLLPVVPNRLAGTALTAFSGSLLAMYLRTPAMHKRAASGPRRPASRSARTSGCSASGSA